MTKHSDLEIHFGQSQRSYGYKNVSYYYSVTDVYRHSPDGGTICRRAQDGLAVEGL